MVPEVPFYVNALTTHPMRPHGAPNGPPRGTGARSTQEQPLVVGYGRQLMLEAPRAAIRISRPAVAHGKVTHGALSALLLAAPAVCCRSNTSRAMMRGRRLPAALPPVGGSVWQPTHLLGSRAWILSARDGGRSHARMHAVQRGLWHAWDICPAVHVPP